MSIFLTILAFLLIFSLLILIHEFGHFYAAKRSGVKVEEFGMGLPPRIWGIQKGETLYSINWIPFGGFVRTLGEGDDSKEAKTSQRSFANQTLRVQAFIVCAGVVMNLLLSFVLLTIGFWMGIEPLIVDEEDFLKELRAGNVQVESGLVVAESSGSTFEVGDRILGYETVEQWNAALDTIQEGGEPISVSVERLEGTSESVFLDVQALEETRFNLLYVPRLVYKANASSLFAGILEEGDVLVSIRVNDIDLALLTEEDLNLALAQVKGNSSLLTVYRPGLGYLEREVEFPFQSPIISYIEPGSPAEMAGLQVSDTILRVGGLLVTSGDQVAELTQSQKSSDGEGESIEYLILRSGEEEALSYQIPLREEDSRVGVGIADLLPYYGELSLYENYTLHSLMDIGEVRYGLSAPLVALEEMWRLGKATAATFGSVLKQFLTGQGVPDGVSGPVGIAQMTGVTIQDGLAATLRFVALLSLSLGVINILPFPALDGGHFFVIVLRAITGKKPNPKLEQMIHSLGFLFLLLFIAYITFNDVLNLF